MPGRVGGGLGLGCCQVAARGDVVSSPATLLPFQPATVSTAAAAQILARHADPAPHRTTTVPAATSTDTASTSSPPMSGACRPNGQQRHHFSAGTPTPPLWRSVLAPGDKHEVQLAFIASGPRPVRLPSRGGEVALALRVPVRADCGHVTGTALPVPPATSRRLPLGCLRRRSDTCTGSTRHRSGPRPRGRRA